MNWLRTWLGAAPRPFSNGNMASATALHKWLNLQSTPLDQPHYETRYVVLNTHSEESNTASPLQALAAVSVERSCVVADESHYAEFAEQTAEDLARSLCWVGHAPIVVFNAGLNRASIEAACAANFDIRLPWIWLDLYVLLPKLFPERKLNAGRLKEWSEACGLEPLPLPPAMRDAHLIAQLLLMALTRAQRRGYLTPLALTELEQIARLEQNSHG